MERIAMTEKAKALISRYKYPILALVLGLAIMLFPASGGGDKSAEGQADEKRLEAVLEQCDGVGSTMALLSDNGAVIVCDGADDAAVRFCVIKAVEAFTGFSSDKIQVIKTAPNIGG